MNLITALYSIFFLLIPNIINVEVYAAFTVPRFFALSVMTLLIFLAWLYYFKKGLVQAVNKYVLIFASCFFIWMLLSTALSMHLPTALLGGYNVNQGFWIHMMYIMLFLLAASLPVNKVILARAIVNSIVILSIYALFQYFNFDPFGFPHGGRPASFTGNTVPMAGAVLLSVPFSVYLAVRAKGIGRIYWSMTIFLFLMVIASSLSRGVMLGVIAITIILSLIYFRQVSKKVIIGSIILVAIFMTATIKYSKSGKAPIERYNITEVTAVKFGDSVDARFQYWHIALRIIKDHPFFGVGLDNFRNAYPLYRTAELDKMERNTLNSKAHNGYLQIAATMGIPALIFYLGLMASVIMVLWRQKGNRLLAMTFLAALIGYMVQNISGWDELGFTPLMWALIGIGVSGENYKPERMNWICGWTEGG